ncbi:MAG: GWxTD domain-containing protein [Bacteroidales bacterium]|nr:GWxTD domain-containing protein [Bacteroidales bacterium]
MKKLKRLLVTLLCCACAPALSAAGLRADLNCLVFHLPDDTSYIELQYLIYGEGLRYLPSEKGGYQGRVRADITLTSIAKKPFVVNRRFFYMTGIYPDSVAGQDKQNNYNLSRIPLPAGRYTLHLCLRDDNDSTATPLCYDTQIDLRFQRDLVSASSLQLIGAYATGGNHSVFTKNGLRLIPYFSSYFPSQVDTLTYMWEIYNTDKVFARNDVGWVESYIAPAGADKAYLLHAPLKNTYTFSPTPRYIHFQSFPIDSLPSGNYYLHNKVFAPDGKLLLNDSFFFQRNNPVRSFFRTPDERIDIDTLKQFIDYLFPIAKGDEVEFIRHAKKDTSYQQLTEFFRAFWLRRNLDDPWDAWFRYYGDVKRVNSKYTTLRFQGYKTDRGYYYLKYGPPNDIEYHPIEEGLNPYEIWRYYILDNQTDVYFIFGDLDLSTKNYTMICSNKKDEVYDPRWKFRLKPKDARPVDIEYTE